MLQATIQNANPTDTVQNAIIAMARQFTDEELLAAMSEVVLDSRPVVARMAAEVAVPRASEQQLRDFLAHNQQKLSPQVLAVFDWHLYAPPYLKEAYMRWQEEQKKMPPHGW